MKRRRALARSVAAILLAVITGCTGPTDRSVRVAGPTAESADLTVQLMVMLDQTDRRALRATTEALLREHGLELVAQWPLDEVGLHCLVLEARHPAARSLAVDRLQRDPRVAITQPMNGFDLLGTARTDPLSDLQAGLQRIEAAPVHAVATGRGVRVAVVDSAVAADHPDLRSRLVAWRDTVGGLDQGAGEAHGTAVAGVIAAARNNWGIVGVAPDAQIVALRACWETPSARRGRCSSFTLARALNLALAADVDILNLSLGGPADPVLEALLSEADRRGIAIVAAAGDGPERAFPGSHPAALAVAAARDVTAVAPGDARLVAPGERVLTTLPPDRYGLRSGASLAAAHASGVAALLREIEPELDPADLRSQLRGDHPETGALQVVNACRSVARVIDGRGGVGPTCRNAAIAPP